MYVNNGFSKIKSDEEILMTFIIHMQYRIFNPIARSEFGSKTLAPNTKQKTLADQ